jgi:uncharacterized coiled-coil protein SlyX
VPIPTRTELAAKVTELEETVEANRLSIKYLIDRVKKLEGQKKSQTSTKK